MAVYTTLIKSWCETIVGNTEGMKPDEIINKALPTIFDFDFPIFDETYRQVLENKIIKHNYFREIGLETVGQFQFFLNERLNLIMPYYNQLYQSATLSYNPLYNVELTRTHNKDNNGVSDTTATSTTKLTTEREVAEETENSGSGTTTDTHSVNSTNNTNAHTIKSDTPQGELSDIAEGKYASEVQYDSGTNTDTQETEGESTQSTSNSGTANRTENGESNGTGRNTNLQNVHNVEEYIEHVNGKQGTQTFSSMVIEYRKTMLNIDKMIIEQLSDLFMNIF